MKTILPCRLPLGLVAALLACGPAPAGRPVPVAIEILAREIAPGEPVRVRARASEPLASLEGRFLDRPIFMVRTPADEGIEIWSGWSMIDLEQRPGPATLEMRGTTAGGGAVRGTMQVTVSAKGFPEERLDVEPRYVEPPAEVTARLAGERELLAGIYEARRSVMPSGRPFLPPVPGEPTSVFGTRRLFNGRPRSPHPGIDLRAATGTEVVASGGGLVALARDLYYSGKTVIVDHGGGLFTVYAHLSELAVAEGRAVAAGERLGLSGATGRVTGPHLHWGAKIGNRPFDPRALLDEALFR